MLDVDIEKLYENLEKKWNLSLKDKGVILPKLKIKEKYTRDALALVYLYNKYKQSVSKTEMTEFISLYYPNINDCQQARHLSAQKGWYILSGTRNDILSKELKMKTGEYLFYDDIESYPGFKKERRVSIDTDDWWSDLKLYYGNRCATCGSLEGTSNFHYPSTITTLQKGHINPNKELDKDNTIPQCSKCNRPDRNYFIYDKKGRVTAINDPMMVEKSDIEVQEKMYEILKKKFQK